MSLFKKLFGIKEKPKTETINIFGNDYVIDVSPEAMQKRKTEYEEEEKSSWIGSNKIERIRDDGYVIYKLNRVSSIEREQIGFYGLKRYSDNGDYCVAYISNDDDEFNIALIDVKLKKVLYKYKLHQPKRCRVTNKGIVVYENWGKQLSSTVYVLDVNGSILLKKRHNSILGDIFEFVENETAFKYSLNLSGKIFTINL